MEKAVQRLRDSPEQPYLDKKCFMSEALNHVRIRYRYFLEERRYNSCTALRILTLVSLLIC